METGDVGLSRILFAFTAMYHFLFVPLTIGLAALVALLEGVGLRTGNPVWRQAARFWGWFFLLNFVCGVVTGYPLRWQLQAHWGAYGALAGDVVTTVFDFEGKVFPVLALAVLMFSFGWRLPARLHFAVSCALALLLIVQSSAILALNAWMQYPVGTVMIDGRAELPRLLALFDNPLLAPKIVHQIASSYTLAGMLVAGLSAWYLLRHRHVGMAQRSFRVASAFTLAALLVTAAAGHWSGITLVKYQPIKFAAIEAIWNTEHASDFVVFALPDMREQSNRYEVAIPGLLGLIAVHANTPVRGLDALSDETAQKIRRDLAATRTLETRTGQKVAPLGAAGLLPDGSTGTQAQIAATARAAIPSVPVVFWAFRVMIAAWAALTLFTLLAVVYGPNAGTARGRLLLWAGLLALPLPWVATEAGWIVCEVGRQPWTVTGVLTTFRSGTLMLDSGLTGLKLLLVSLTYSGLFVLNATLCLRHVRRGPQPLAAPSVWAVWSRRAVASLQKVARRGCATISAKIKVEARLPPAGSKSIVNVKGRP